MSQHQFCSLFKDLSCLAPSLPFHTYHTLNTLSVSAFLLLLLLSAPCLGQGAVLCSSTQCRAWRSPCSSSVLLLYAATVLIPSVPSFCSSQRRFWSLHYVHSSHSSAAFLPPSTNSLHHVRPSRRVLMAALHSFNPFLLYADSFDSTVRAALHILVLQACCTLPCYAMPSHDLRFIPSKPCPCGNLHPQLLSCQASNAVRPRVPSLALACSLLFMVFTC